MTPYVGDVVRGRLDDAVGSAILDFWQRHRALTGDAARDRLAQVVAVLRDASGDLVGVSSAYGAEVELLANRRLWIYRRFLAPDVDDDGDDALFNAAFDALSLGFDPDGGGPIGVCWYLDDRSLLARRRAVVWAATRLLYAGYAADGRQSRIRYFAGARIT